jgi:U3 small nucleolar ribonucleoprotein protein IMP3
MPRKLKYHEQRLLRKVDFLNWKQDSNLREVKILRRYHVQDREDYHTYNKIAGVVTQVPALARPARRPVRVLAASRVAELLLPAMARQLVAALKKLDQRDPVRAELTDALVDKLYALGLVPQKRLLACIKLPTSSFCRRRLPVVMVRLRMAETVKQAAELVEQGHVRVGPESVTDPAFLVTRAMEDHVTWVDTSRIKRTVMKYNEKLDDFDML